MRLGSEYASRSDGEAGVEGLTPAEGVDIHENALFVYRNRLRPTDFSQKIDFATIK
jgi:hypothetical protein